MLHTLKLIRRRQSHVLHDGAVPLVRMQEVEDRFVLQEHKARRVLAIGIFYQLKRFLFMLHASGFQRQPKWGEVVMASTVLVVAQLPFGNCLVTTALQCLSNSGDRFFVPLEQIYLFQLVSGIFF